jgi:phosphoserine phosphatase
MSSINFVTSRRAFLIGSGSLMVATSASGLATGAEDDPLPSWNDTATKAAILSFLAGSADPNDEHFVPVEERIAVFDMDGTLIPEQPAAAAVFPVAATLHMAVQRQPALAETPAVAAALKQDWPAVAATGEQGISDIIAAVTAGKTVEDAALEIRRLTYDEKNVHFNRPLRSLGYRPMLELLSALQAQGFRNWICSGSPVLFTRQVSSDMFNIDPERVMGTSIGTHLVEQDGTAFLVFDNVIEHLNDKEGKPPTINLAIGARPAFVGGNVRSGGDIAMMRYSKGRSGPSFQLLINHDDAEREFAYGEPGDVSLAAASQFGFQVVSMKNDWSNIFNPQ